VRHGIEITNLGDYADSRVAARLAQAAEEAGWEGLFVWDHLAFAWGVPSGDPWVSLSTRLKLGTAITSLARRRQQVVANALATLDLLERRACGLRSRAIPSSLGPTSRRVRHGGWRPFTACGVASTR
jgi:Luciferase-like monooxygenase